MPSNLDVFIISGPKHLSSVNWSCPNYQRIIMACLVQATVITEKDRENKLEGPQALASQWCNPFNFELKERLIDDFDSSIFGCVFEFKSELNLNEEAPRFVVAFRGTLPDLKHGLRDGLLDLSVILGGINKSSRFEKSIEIIQKLILDFGTSNVWLAGYSLGASIATIAGKFMAKMDIHLKTFLFNPPFATISLDLIPNIDKKLKETIYAFKTVFKTGLAILAKNNRKRSHETFSKLANWTPYLFVNPDDPISTNYIHYFEHRRKMEAKGIGFVGQFESRISIREIFSDVIGGKSEMSYLLPTASLRVNLKKLSGWYEAHGIHQWWHDDIHLEYYDYYQLKHDS